MRWILIILWPSFLKWSQRRTIKNLHNNILINFPIGFLRPCAIFQLVGMEMYTLFQLTKSSWKMHYKSFTSFQCNSTNFNNRTWNNLKSKRKASQKFYNKLQYLLRFRNKKWFRAFIKISMKITLWQESTCRH